MPWEAITQTSVAITHAAGAVTAVAGATLALVGIIEKIKTLWESRQPVIERWRRHK